MPSRPMADSGGLRRYTPPPWNDDSPVCTTSTRPEVKHDPGGELRKFLADGEHLLGLVGFGIAPGRRTIGEPPDGRSRGEKAAEGAADAVTILLGWGNSPSLSKMLRVESVSAHIGSVAYRLLQAYRDERRGLRRLLVTDQRFTLVNERAGGKGDRYQALLDIPREALADVRVVPKPLVRGRVVLTFTDGSLIALKYGTWRSGAARHLVDAIGRWRTHGR